MAQEAGLAVGAVDHYKEIAAGPPEFTKFIVELIDEALKHATDRLEDTIFDALFASVATCLIAFWRSLGQGFRRAILVVTVRLLDDRKITFFLPKEHAERAISKIGPTLKKTLRSGNLKDLHWRNDRWETVGEGLPDKQT